MQFLNGSEMNSSIIADLQTHAIVDNKTMQENTNPISDFFDGLGIYNDSIYCALLWEVYFYYLRYLH